MKGISNAPNNMNENATATTAITNASSKDQPRTRIPKKIPLPVSIELHNVFLKDPTISSQSSQSSPVSQSKSAQSVTNSSNNYVKRKKLLYHRREYKSDLLYKVQLDILIHSSEPPATQVSSNSKKRISIYHEICSLPPTVCPVWRHINDDTIGNSNSNNFNANRIRYDTLSEEEYNTMTARISIVTDDDTTATSSDTIAISTQQQPLHNQQLQSNRSGMILSSKSSSHNNNRDRTNSDAFYFYYNDDSSCHDSIAFNNINDNNDTIGDSYPIQETNINNSTTAPSSSSHTIQQQHIQHMQHQQFNKVLDIPIHPSKLIKIGYVPYNLPLNCLVVYYSDGTIRIQPSHYQVLYNQQHDNRIVPNPVTTNNYNSNNNNQNQKYLSLSQQSSFSSEDIVSTVSSATGPQTKSSTKTTTNTKTTAAGVVVKVFDDDAFYALDSPILARKTKATDDDNNKSYDDNLFPDIFSTSFNDSNKHHRNSSKQKQQQQNGCNLNQSDNGEEFLSGNKEQNVLHTDYDNQPSIITALPAEDEEATSAERNDAVMITTTDVVMKNSVHDDNNLIKSDEKVEFDRLITNQKGMERLSDEQQLLKQLIAEEEDMIQREIIQCAKNQNSMQQVIDQIRLIEQHNIIKIKDETTIERTSKKRYEFLIESQSIRLIAELSTIYYINVILIDRRYMIRNIEIPKFDSNDSMNATTSGANTNNVAVHITDDDLSAGLGFICHTVQMLSIYLHVHLRYKLVCYSSRSSIIDAVSVARSNNNNYNNKASSGGSTGVYPLYQARGVEKEQLEYAVHLLNCNVDCLCKSRNVKVSLNSHILAKIKRIFESVIEGY